MQLTTSRRSSMSKDPEGNEFGLLQNDPLAADTPARDGMEVISGRRGFAGRQLLILDRIRATHARSDPPVTLNAHQGQRALEGRTARGVGFSSLDVDGLSAHFRVQRLRSGRFDAGLDADIRKHQPITMMVDTVEL